MTARRILDSRNSAMSSSAIQSVSTVAVAEPRRYRTLLRVTAIHGKKVSVLVPAWDPQVPVEVAIGVFPQTPAVTKGSRYIASVNLSAKSQGDLTLKDVTVAPEPAAEIYG